MNRITRRNFLQTAGAATAAWAARPALAQQRPLNVLYILTDQQRADTLGCYGNPKAETPVLDGLAAGGVRFTSCYATQPVCSPCRSSMVTGLYPNATGVVENNIPLRPDLFSWPRALHERGYRTGYIGKWHLGTDPVPAYFDVWQGYHTTWKHWIEEEPIYQRPGESKADYDARVAAAEDRSGPNVGRYRPDLETDHAIDFIRSGGDAPFLCWLSFYPPHTVKTVPEEDLARFRGRFDTEEQDTYYAMVYRLDKNIGRVVAALEETGQRENTLIVFVTDHGENFPWRWNEHHKRLCYDQSANLPLILNGPGIVPAGTVIDNVISAADLMPTILDYCGVPAPAERHGQSARRLIEGDPTGWHEDVLIQNTPYKPGDKPIDGVDVAAMRERAVVTDDWKFILNTDREPELYRRHAGPPDQDNVFGQAEPELLRDLARRLAAWGERTGDAMTGELVAKWASRWAN